MHFEGKTMQKLKSQQQTLLTESVDKNKVEYHIGIEPKEGDTPWYQQPQLEHSQLFSCTMHVDKNN
jgi:hypothetical protein